MFFFLISLIKKPFFLISLTLKWTCSEKSLNRELFTNSVVSLRKISNYLKLVLETQSHCSVAPPSCYQVARYSRQWKITGEYGPYHYKDWEGETLSCIGRGSQTQETALNDSLVFILIGNGKNIILPNLLL